MFTYYIGIQFSSSMASIVHIFNNDNFFEVLEQVFLQNKRDIGMAEYEKEVQQESHTPIPVIFIYSLTLYYFQACKSL